MVGVRKCQAQVSAVSVDRTLVFAKRGVSRGCGRGVGGGTYEGLSGGDKTGKYDGA